MDSREGFGTYFQAQDMLEGGSYSYKGEFLDDWINGKGCKTWADGSTYTG